jgi:hypothetical protein
MRELEEQAQIGQLKKNLEKFPEEQRGAIKKIIEQLFPRTSAAFSNTSYGTSWYDTWAKEKRICSPRYCHRYFEFGVSDEDISDYELGQFIQNLTARTEERNSSELRKLVSGGREEVFLDKVSLLVDTLGEDAAIKLAKAISMSGNVFPKGSSRDALILTLNPFSQAARLLRALVERILDNSQREELATELATLISPLDFAYEYFTFARYIGKVKNEPETDNELSSLAKGVITKVVDRIEIEAEEEYLENRFPQFSAHLYRAWLFEKPDSAKNHLEKRFTKDPQEAEDFVLSFYKQAWDVNGVAILWGLDFVVSAIEKLHPDIELLPLDGYQNDAHYLTQGDKEYLRFFLSIAKKQAPHPN